jgi:membrane-bound serine protease (ClpP class)
MSVPLLAINSWVILAQAAPGGDQSVLLLMGLVCLAVAVILLVVEMFVPASGTLALTAGMALATGIVLLVWGGGTIGRITAVAALIAAPFAVMGLLWLWPHTPLAKMITLHSHSDQGRGEALAAGTPAPAPAVGVGARGTAMTDLRPIGTCLFGSQRVECLAEGGMIDTGTNVVVVAVDGIVTKVRPA